MAFAWLRTGRDAEAQQKVPPPAILVSPITRSRRTTGQWYCTRIHTCRSTGVCDRTIFATFHILETKRVARTGKGNSSRPLVNGHTIGTATRRGGESSRESSVPVAAFLGISSAQFHAVSASLVVRRPSNRPAPRESSALGDRGRMRIRRKRAKRQKLPKLWPFSHLGQPTCRFSI